MSIKDNIYMFPLATEMRKKQISSRFENLIEPYVGKCIEILRALYSKIAFLSLWW